jgi:hypothetical protein
MAWAGVPCGDTAAAVEAALGPFDVKWTGAGPLPRVVRLHFQVDADNQCQDHVMFVAPCPEGPPGAALWVLDSYIGVRGATLRTLPAQWLTHQVAALQAAAAGLAFEELAPAGAPRAAVLGRPAPGFCAAWAATLDVPAAAADFLAPLVMDLHASVPGLAPTPAHVAAVFLGTT